MSLLKYANKNTLNLVGLETDKFKVLKLLDERRIYRDENQNIIATKRIYLVLCKNCLKSNRACTQTIRNGRSGCDCKGQPYFYSFHECYSIWNGLKHRCLNETDNNYFRYGARGIKVCQGFHNFEFFVLMVGDRPPLEHSIDRIDNDAHYSCGECEECKNNNWNFNLKWSTAKEQSYNRRSNILVEYNGEKFPMKFVCQQLNIPYKLVWKRMKNFEESFEDVRIVI